MSIMRMSSQVFLGKKTSKAKASKAKTSKKPKAEESEEEEEAPAKKKLTPLEKARLARASGKKKATKRPAKKVFTFSAPEDMKASLLRMLVVIGKDGLPTKLSINSYKGKPGGENTKILPLHVYDPETLVKVAARVGSAVWANRVDKRLPAKTMFAVLIRVLKNKEGNVMSRIRGVSMKTGDSKFKEVNRNTDVGKLALRMFRKLHKIGPGAFTQLKPFPDAKAYKAIVEAMEGKQEEAPKGKKVKNEEEAPAKKPAKKVAKKVARPAKKVAKRPAKKVAAKKPAKKAAKKTGRKAR